MAFQLPPRALRLGLAAVVLAGIAAGVVWLRQPEKPEAPDQQARRTQPGQENAALPPASEFHGVRLVDQDADGTQWTLRAERGIGWESKGTGKLEVVKVEFERRGKKVEVAAPRGEVTDAQTVTLSGGVTVTCEDYTATVERATYYRGKGEIRSDDDVELLGPDFSVRGKGLVLDLNDQRARVLAQARAVVGRKKK